MTLLRAARPAAILLTIAIALAFFAGNQRHVSASIVEPGLGSRIVCSVFTWLDAQGHPIPHLLPNGCPITPPPGSGTITVVKQVSGGSASASDFSIHIKAGGVDINGSPQPGSSSGTAYTGFPPGSYSVSETGGPATYTASFSGACNASGVVTIAVGDILTCTITNTFNATPPNPENTLALCSDGVDNDGDGSTDLADTDCAAFAPSLTIVKHSVGGDGPFSFSLAGATTNSATVTTFAGAATSSALSLSLGETTLTENAATDWTLTGLRCVSDGATISATLPGGAHITAHAGDSVTCTFTNTVQGGGAAQCSDDADNDGDGKIDAADPGCHTDHNPYNVSSYDANLDNEAAVGGTQCSDEADNDSDGLIDSADPGCHTDFNPANQDSFDPTGSDESATAPSGGGPITPSGGTTPTGGGGGNGPSAGSYGLVDGTAGGMVLGAATATVATTTAATPLSCDTYLTAFIKSGQANDPQQVRRLQVVLHDFEGANIAVNGIYDDATLAAVHALQTKYASVILTPWGIGKSTGFVYLTTRKKVNEIYCRNTKQFPLTEAQLQEIARMRATAGAQQVTPPSAPSVPTQPVEKAPVPASSTPVSPPVAVPEAQIGAVSGAATSGANVPEGRGLWNFIDFLRRFLPSR